MTQITGTIIKLFDTQQVSDKFSKREVAIKTTDQYPQEILVQFAQKNIEKLDGFKEGEDVSISYNLRGRSFPKKDGSGVSYFNTIEGWKIEREVARAANNPATGGNFDDGGELPF